jgi:hypothetical protein
MDGDQEQDMIIVRWVWIGLNILLVIYAIILYLYAKYWPKKEIRNYVICNNLEKFYRGTYYSQNRNRE